MKKFQFKLEKLQKVRKLKEQQAIKSMAEQNLKLEEANRVLDKNRDTQESVKNSQEENRVGKIDIHAWKNFNLFLQNMRKDEINDIQRVYEEEQKLEKKREVVKRRTTERKIVDKLEEIQVDQYKKDLLAYEQKEFDDIASQRFSRSDK